jgi:hypothetical protein
MAEDRWTDPRNTEWERERRRERAAHGRDLEDRVYADPAVAGRPFDEPMDDRGYRPHGADRGSMHGYAEGPRTASYRDFEEIQRRRHGGDYDPARYTPNPRGGRGEDVRTWWDRTQDELSALFGDEEARRRREWDERRAETLGDHRGRGPKGYRRSDERVREDINDRLTDDRRLDASEIEVAVLEGEVTLSGTVFRREDKRRAEDIAEHVSGVTHVQNNLRLQS